MKKINDEIMIGFENMFYVFEAFGATLEGYYLSVLKSFDPWFDPYEEDIEVFIF